MDQKEYKGRDVFRGDQVKDQDGHLAIFTEQGASASSMSATKFLDAIARMTHNHGEDSDAFSAYTQVNLDQLPTLLGAEAAADLVTETWISLPRDRRPKEWDNIEEPMVRLRVNMYGHPCMTISARIARKGLIDCGVGGDNVWE